MNCLTYLGYCRVTGVGSQTIFWNLRSLILESSFRISVSSRVSPLEATAGWWFLARCPRRNHFGSGRGGGPMDSANSPKGPKGRVSHFLDASKHELHSFSVGWGEGGEALLSGIQGGSPQYLLRQSNHGDGSPTSIQRTPNRTPCVFGWLQPENPTPPTHPTPTPPPPNCDTHVPISPAGHWWHSGVGRDQLPGRPRLEWQLFFPRGFGFVSKWGPPKMSGSLFSSPFNQPGRRVPQKQERTHPNVPNSEVSPWLLSSFRLRCLKRSE